MDAFEDIMRKARREGPERFEGRHHCLNKLLKPLGYLSSGARVSNAFYISCYSCYFFPLDLQTRHKRPNVDREHLARTENSRGAKTGAEGRALISNPLPVLQIFPPAISSFLTREDT